MKKKLEPPRFEKGFFGILLLILALAISNSSCRKEVLTNSAKDASDVHAQNPATTDAVTSRSDFTPTASISYQSGMLVFATHADLDMTLKEINDADASSVDAWESSIGFTSQRRLFNQIVSAEDAIDDYYWSLSPSQQEQALSQDPVHSTIFNDKLASGFIKNVTDPNDASVYWDYGSVSPEKSAVLSETGFVKAEGQIFQFTNGNLIKIIKDGDFNKISQLANYDSEYSDGTFSIATPACPNDPGCLNLDFSKTNSWKSAGNDKRVKVTVEGTACANWALSYGDCAFKPHGTQCKFLVRTQAQKKNFWGKWKYQSSFSPSLTIASATWKYQYSLFNDGCSGSFTTTDNAGLIGSYPTPTYTTFVPATNNGYFHLNPSTSGYWVWQSPNKKYIQCTVDVYEYNIPASYSLYGPSDWNLVRP
ncbi:MAG: hypothetical protein K9J37_23675 [Saprospiraceae bacterium]|nr:hypothetical protein [Saprospiraceae bacterium]MCF8252927.1 hypothetical protein [Saprospiraceae bacterium]MCF8314469.1 hypothetical protein [Saprospiraceae bacterium]MCF8443354.1 hypothetical protein [Saprospiraceae bacterium]